MTTTEEALREALTSLLAVTDEARVRVGLLSGGEPGNGPCTQLYDRMSDVMYAASAALAPSVPSPSQTGR